jgi:NitT/TauT family transport system permease protein
MGNSFVTIIAAELVATNAGLGKMMGDARLYMLVDQIFVALLVLGLLDRLFRWGIYAFGGRFSPVT